MFGTFARVRARIDANHDDSITVELDRLPHSHTHEQTKNHRTTGQCNSGRRGSGPAAERSPAESWSNIVTAV